MVYSVEGRINLVFLLQPAWLPPLPSVDVTANLPGYIILSGYQFESYNFIEASINEVVTDGLELGQQGYT